MCENWKRETEIRSSRGGRETGGDGMILPDGKAPCNIREGK